MLEFLTEFVGVPEDMSFLALSPVEVRQILEGLWVICSAESSGAGSECDWSPKGDFRFRRRTAKDRTFRKRDFEGSGAGTGKAVTADDGGPGRGGIDMLGKYSLSDSTVTIYADSCRKFVQRRFEGNFFEELTDVVLIHELAHLITHRVYGLKYTNEDESSHIWEHTAQCATYSYLKTPCSHYSKSYKKGHYGLSVLNMFERLSSLQPLIYRTWEVYRTWSDLKIFDRSEALGRRFLTMIEQMEMNCALTLKPTPPEDREDVVDIERIDE